jgi:histidinol-phosphate aminotransferase
MKVKPPYNINAVTSRLALQALERPETMQRFVEAIVSERTKLADTLRLLPTVKRVFPSEANFLLVRFRNAPAIYHYLAGRGIIVRDRSAEPLLENCLRITVGTPAENDALINALKEFVG